MSGIAISGKAGAGKSTMAKHILAACEERGIPAVKIAFGDELKREVLDLYGIDKFMVGGREALIRHGEARRAADPLYWIKPVAQRVRLAQVCGVLPVLDDVRFRTEYQWVRASGFRTVRMHASPDWREDRMIRQGICESIVYSDSVTETQLDGVEHDVRVRNCEGARLDRRAIGLLDGFV